MNQSNLPHLLRIIQHIRMCSKFFAFIALPLLAFEVTQIYAKFEFTNINCTSLDESFATFEYCYLKSVNRTYKFASIKWNPHKGTITAVKLNLAVYQRLNGYKPFLYNVTVDGCKLLVNPKSYPVARFIKSLWSPYSNMNHSCPYDHPVIVEKVPISHMDHQLSTVLPFPKAKYGFHSIWTVNGKVRALVNIYASMADFCKFMANRNSYPVARFIGNLFLPYSNINHSCPYDHPFMVEKIPISHIDYQLSTVLPFPKGEYGFHSISYAYGIPRVQVNAYGTLS